MIASTSAVAIGIAVICVCVQLVGPAAAQTSGLPLFEGMKQEGRPATESGRMQECLLAATVVSTNAATTGKAHTPVWDDAMADGKRFEERMVAAAIREHVSDTDLQTEMYRELGAFTLAQPKLRPPLAEIAAKTLAECNVETVSG